MPLRLGKWNMLARKHVLKLSHRPNNKHLQLLARCFHVSSRRRIQFHQPPSRFIQPTISLYHNHKHSKHTNSTISNITNTTNTNSNNINNTNNSNSHTQKHHIHTKSNINPTNTQILSHHLKLSKNKPILPYPLLSSLRSHSTASSPDTSSSSSSDVSDNFKPRQTGRPIYDPLDEHNTNRPHDSALPHRSTIVFSMTDQTGALEKVLRIFATNQVNLTRINSRYGASHSIVSFFVDIDLPANHRRVKKVLEALKSPNNSDYIVSADIMGSKEVPWFPITMEEVDSLALLVLEGGSDLEADHPGFNDPQYRERRQEIANYAANFQFGDKPKRIDYVDNEVNAWSQIWHKLEPLLYKHACPQYIEAFEQLQKHCGYKKDHIPQLCDVTDFLYDQTGFRLRPTAGLISSRHFLNGLAFRIFFCTQYLRHWSVPFYTPEPDVVHELVGHAPLFANPEFADFSQEIGLASIGATDEEIVQLARCYWFSVEFGLCRSAPGASDRKIYGAGILSSFGEIEYSMSEEPEIREWDPFQAAHQDYPITKYQPIYYIADSFEDAKEKLVEFAESFDKPFSVKWNDVKEKLIVDRNIRRGPRNYQDFGEYVGSAEDDNNNNNDGNGPSDSDKNDGK